MKPIELLEEKLKIMEESLQKSKLALAEGQISLLTHETHILNIVPKIKQYREAIRILYFYTT